MSKVSAIAILLVLISILFIGCPSKADTASATKNQIATVGRGGIKVNIMAAGNLASSNEANLTFGSSGTVREVLVGIGDYVEEGKVLAKLDTLDLERKLIQAQIDVKTAQLNLERALMPTTTSSGTQVLSAPDPLDIEIKQFQLNNAKSALKDAGIKLEKATMVAPFAGLVAAVNVAVNDQIAENTVAVRLIDSKKFKVDIMVNEMEIYQVKVGTPGTVRVNAIPTIALPAKVAHISPSATVQSNVVNYKVEVEVNPQEMSVEEQTSPRTSAVEIPERLKQAIETGQMTREQVEQMMRQRQQGAQQRQTSATVTKGLQLREGLTVTVSILVEERNNVLLVPNRSITSRGGKSYVQVLSSSGATEERAIQAGIADSQNTEVINGLSEGEKVVIPQRSTTTTTTTATQQQRPPSGGVVPGMGRMLR